MALDIIDILLARASASGGGSGGGDTSDAVMNVTVESADTSAAKIKQMKVRKNNITRAYEMMKNYVSRGNNEDGSMTQKAITSELNDLTGRISSANVTISEMSGRLDAAFNAINVHDAWGYRLEEQINQNTSSIESLNTQAGTTSTAITNINNNIGAINQQIEDINDRIDDIVTGDVNLGPENAGKIVLVGDDGGLVPGTLTEQDIIDGGGVRPPEPVSALGLEIDYVNKTCTRLDEAVGLNPGSDFDKYSMYGGRRRCAVDYTGLINDFYGDSAYSESGKDGEVMIYQPKFYYKREILGFKDANSQQIAKERLYISDQPLTGFKLHPLFYNEAGEEVNYVFLSAYEGSMVDTTLSSPIDDDTVAIDFTHHRLQSTSGRKPYSGAVNAFNAENAEGAAQAIGTGWHITNMRAESANQMLMMIEYGTMNMQAAMELGPSSLNITEDVNCSLITGSTSALGNASGAAESSVQTIRGVETTYTTVGKRAISYRGMENPWGDLWRIVGGVVLSGNGSQRNGIPYICNNYNYSPDNLENNYTSCEFIVYINGDDSYISTMGYAGTALDWVYLPISGGGNSSAPVGDYVWGLSNLNGINRVNIGGNCHQGAYNGIFHYALDREYDYAKSACGARIMFVPTKNATYTANITKWQQGV